MSRSEVEDVLAKLNGATEPGSIEDGTRVHVHYGAYREATESAKSEANHARQLGLPLDRYTGRVSRIWNSSSGDQMLTMLVELERDHKFRTFNIDKGRLHNIVILGD